MEDNQDRVSGFLNDTLTITNVEVADAMDYTCNVSLAGVLFGVSTISLEIQGEISVASMTWLAMG